MDGQFRSWAEIDTGALCHNAGALAQASPPGVGLIAIVKAGAYGHGAGIVAPALAGRVAGYGVANLAEARELAALPHVGGVPILILSPVLPHERAGAVAGGFEVSVSTVAEAEAFAAAAAGGGRPARVHAVADTGMGRMGARPDEFAGLVGRIRDLARGGAIELAGVATHLPSADEEEAFTHRQIADFRDLVQALRLGPEVAVHLANSAGTLGYREEMDFVTHVRPGLALYGVSPLPAHQSALRPVLTWKTRLSLVRDLPTGATISYGRTRTLDRPSRVATLATGYADGYPRHLSGRGAEVLIGGSRCPVLGRVTMDQIVVDVTDVPGRPEAGEEAVLIGRQGGGTIAVDEMAEKAGTIVWEILTGIGPRVVRVAV